MAIELRYFEDYPAEPSAQGDEPMGLSCRLYQTPDGSGGSPSFAQLAVVLGVDTRADDVDGG